MRTLSLKQLGVAIACLGLAACMGNTDAGGGASPAVSPSGNASSPSPSLASTLSAQQAPAGLGCGWQTASDPDRTNIAFPDTSAKYWVASVLLTPGNRLRIDGQYPDARYFSFNVYDPALRPTDALADVEISPKNGRSNPFSTPNGRPGGAYTAYLTYGQSPTQNASVPRAPNTLYGGNVALGPGGSPNFGLVTLIYRIYVSHSGDYFNGGVPLPQLTLESADGKNTIATLPNCEEPLLPTFGGLAPKPGLNNALVSADYPDQLPTFFPIGTYPPKSAKFFSLPDTVLGIGREQTGVLPPTPDVAPLNGGGGFLSNIHNAYTSTTFNRRYGNIVLVRAKAPTFRGARGVGFNQEQMRYWSICGNEFATQRFTQCAADYQTAIDANGYFTAVVSDLADRPANATAANGFTWLAWGAYPDMVVIYRHMLANPAFKQSIQNQPFGGDLKAGMGEYYPEAAYCDKATFEQSNNPAEAFALCSKYQFDHLKPGS